MEYVEAEIPVLMNPKVASVIVPPGTTLNSIKDDKESFYKLKFFKYLVYKLSKTNSRRKMSDSVNHPSHYTDGKIEVIEYIEDKGFNYHLGNAIKYISRAGKKDKSKTAEDLRKAVWYIERYISILEKK